MRRKMAMGDDEHRRRKCLHFFCRARAREMHQMFTKRSEYEREGTRAPFSSLCARFIANCTHRASFLSAFVFSDEDSAYPFRDTCSEIRSLVAYQKR